MVKIRGQSFREWVVLQAVISTVENQAGDGLLSITNLPTPCGGGEAGTTPLLHFLYKSPMRAQVIMPAFAPPLDTPGLQQVGLQYTIANR